MNAIQIATAINDRILTCSFLPAVYMLTARFTCQVTDQRIFLGKRLIVTVQITSPNGGLSWRQPFYRSLGKNNPDRSPAGQWLPIHGVAVVDDLDTWLDKSYWCPLTRAWQRHNKDVNELPPQLQDVCELLGQLIPSSFVRPE